MKTITIAAVILALCATASLAHPGGLDKDGCHHNKKTGEYHCHRGPKVPTPTPRGGAK